MINKPIILFLSTNDKGGAGVAFLKSVEMLRSKGYDATLMVCNKYSDSEVCIGVNDARSTTGRIRIALNKCYCKFRKLLAFGKTEKKYIMFDIQLSMVSAKQILSLYGKCPTIIRVGWVTDFVSTMTIKDLQERTGALIEYSMVDNASITGGCHYPWDCNGYTCGCYKCPALKPNNLRAHRTLLFKQKFITPGMVISGTTSDINRARRSLLFKDCKHVVSYVLRPNPYCFTQSEGRSYFGIGEDRFVLFCGAASFAIERKGFKELVDSLEMLKYKIDIKRITVLVAGDEQTTLPAGYDVKRVGVLPYKDLFLAYACSDLFLCPSLEDSGPMMINYGVMAYKPVIAFEVGIALDIIRHKKNGYLARWRDVCDFADGIMYCIENHETMCDGIKELNNRIIEESKNASIWNYLGIELS